VAPTVSTILKPEPEVVWRGADVTIGEVLDALDAIRKKFSFEEAGDAELPHPRNWVMTLIAVASDDQEERRAQRVCRVIGAQHPAQVIVIRDNAELRGGHIEASISTDIMRPESACAVECELVTLRVRGGAAEHLDALIDPLLVSGVPTYLWWVGTPPFGTHELDGALKVCDALVVDSARFDAPYHSFLGLSRLATSGHHKLGVADFQWSRLGPWRETIAQFFSPPGRRPFLAGISGVGIDYVGEGRGNRIAPALLTGWLSFALGWKQQRAAAGGGGVVAAHFVGEGWRPIDVNFRSVLKAHLASGEVSTVRISGASGGETFHLTVQRDPERMPDRQADSAYRTLHRTGGDDEAGLELAERTAEWHRDVLHENRDALHHTATGEPPGDSTPRPPVVFTRERRHDDSSLLLLTVIELGAAEPLRHVQRIEPDDDAALLLDLLSGGVHDAVFTRSLVSAADLMRSV
jgi:glucose-6-phosphate dehydrogenase assembly protein OpcA